MNHTQKLFVRVDIHLRPVRLGRQDQQHSIFREMQQLVPRQRRNEQPLVRCVEHIRPPSVLVFQGNCHASSHGHQILIGDTVSVLAAFMPLGYTVNPVCPLYFKGKSFPVSATVRLPRSSVKVFKRFITILTSRRFPTFCESV